MPQSFVRDMSNETAIHEKKKTPVPKLRFKEFKGGWIKKKLSEVSVFLDGKRKPIKESDRAKMRGQFPYYGASGIIDYVNDYIFDDEIILLGEDGENIVSRNLPLAFKVIGKCWVNNHAHVIKPNQDTDIDFLTHILERTNYEIYNTGTAQPKLNQEVCKSIPLNISSLPEQQKIASFLSAVDEKIQQLTRKKELLEQYKKGVMQQLFSGKLRFKDENGKPYPKWESKTLGEVVEIMTDYVAAGSFESLRNNVVVYDEPNFAIYVRLTDLRHNLTEGSLKYVDQASYEFLRKSNLYGGEILVANIGANVGDVYLMPFNRGYATVAPNMIVIRENLKTFYSNFLYYYFTSYHGRNSINSVISGSGQPKLSKTDLKKVRVSLPNLNEQTQVANFLSALDIKIERVAAQIVNTKIFKKGLLQQMFV